MSFTIEPASSYLATVLPNNSQAVQTFIDHVDFEGFIFMKDGRCAFPIPQWCPQNSLLFGPSKSAIENLMSSPTAFATAFAGDGYIGPIGGYGNFRIASNGGFIYCYTGGTLL